MLQKTKINPYHIVLKNTLPNRICEETIYIVHPVKNSRTKYNVTIVYGTEYSETTTRAITSFNIAEDIKQWHEERQQVGV